MLNRSSCFRGGEIVSGHWHESLWSHSPNVAPGLPSGVALMTSDGVDSFSIVNEGGAGAAAKRHCLVRRVCGHPTQGQRLATLNSGKSGLWVNSVGDHDQESQMHGLSMEDWPGMMGSAGGLVRYKGDGAIVGADIHPSEQYLIMATAKGTVLVFHTWTVELRGIFSAEMRPSQFVRGLCIDPHGLYVALGMGTSHSTEGSDERRGRGRDDEKEEVEEVKDGFITDVDLYEIVRGENALDRKKELKAGFAGIAAAAR